MPIRKVITMTGTTRNGEEILMSLAYQNADDPTLNVRTSTEYGVAPASRPALLPADRCLLLWAAVGVIDPDSEDFVGMNGSLYDVAADGEG